MFRLFAVVTASLLIGFVSGYPFIVLSIGLLLHIFLTQKRLQRVLRSMRQSDTGPSPEIGGIYDQILREADRARKHHHERERKLTQNLKRFQSATTALPDAVVLLGESGRIDWANDKAADYLGVNWPEDDNQRISNLLRDPRLQQLLENSAVIDSDDRLELSLILRPNLYLEFRLVPYGDDRNLLVARDITEIHNTNQMRRDFVANASHELRTPLTVIAGYLEAFESDMAADNALSGIIRKMRAHTNRMQRLIEDLLKLSSLESVRSEWGEVIVPELLSSVFNEAKTLSVDLKHIFYLETDPNLWLKGNQSELYSAFSNLVFNAVQYTPEKGVIRVRWYEADGQACMEVRDSGDGIANEHLPRLTERFYRVDKGRSRDRGGTGLGLAIVKHVLSNHNARLEISSEPGNGSTFRCVFNSSNIIHKPAEDETSLSA